jgi:hypothetical protein
MGEAEFSKIREKGYGLLCHEKASYSIAGQTLFERSCQNISVFDKSCGSKIKREAEDDSMIVHAPDCKAAVLGSNRPHPRFAANSVNT